MKQFLYLFFFLFSFLFHASGQVRINQATDFVVTDVDGHRHRLFDYLDEGKHVLLSFFFTSCNACIYATPTLNDAYKKYGCNSEDIVFVGINQGGTDAQVLSYDNSYGGYFPVISGLEGDANQIVADYGVTAYPTVVLIAPNRQIVAKDIYPVTKVNLDLAIQEDADILPQLAKCPLADLHRAPKDNIQLRLFPNPIVTDASIEIRLAKSMYVTVHILNILGQKVETPIDGFLTQPVTKVVKFDSLKPGMYLLQLIADGKVISTQRFSKISP